MGINRSTYYAWLSGAQLPGRDVLNLLIRAWGGEPTHWLERRREVEEALEPPRPTPKAPSANNITLRELSRLSGTEEEGRAEFKRIIESLYMAALEPPREVIATQSGGIPISAVAMVLDGGCFKEPHHDLAVRTTVVHVLYRLASLKAPGMGQLKSRALSLADEIYNYERRRLASTRGLARGLGALIPESDIDSVGEATMEPLGRRYRNLKAIELIKLAGLREHEFRVGLRGFREVLSFDPTPQQLADMRGSEASKGEIEVVWAQLPHAAPNVLFGARVRVLRTMRLWPWHDCSEVQVKAMFEATSAAARFARETAIECVRRGIK
ncbi:hypothetical protein [Streptomyces rimosus]|uniref:hypothetical protein n=1 Tax=Streptomyces rimosus TaxID=1927 RepID=UPI0037990DB9